MLAKFIVPLKQRFEMSFKKEDRLTLVLGVLGFVLIYLHFPFDWSLPEYALY